MIAEIHNKISHTGSNLSDRLEDQLTGDFFGAIRYLPFQQGLKHVLAAVRFEDDVQAPDSSWRKLLDSIQDFDYTLHFWPRHAEGEIDLIIDHPEVVIGIEVKYYSGISSDDEDLKEVSPEASRHQLARYAKMLEDIRNGRPAYLVFLAPFGVLLPVEADIKSRAIIPLGIHLGFLAWQNVLEQIQTVDTASCDRGQQMIIRDLTDLLKKKGFERFRGFLTGEVRQLTTLEQVYTFKAKAHEYQNMIWPTKTAIKEEHCVFNK
ncbi:NERD domain-containing protein [Paenibacillus oralis]|uniref:NERD domain-containing protein n=1 Tax=Paenibacillus oralis TaxID=2490856 RepID=UPI0015AF9E28|nr:NERD domain-containing protein [Paenibacillus oralis]